MADFPEQNPNNFHAITSHNLGSWKKLSGAINLKKKNQSAVLEEMLNRFSALAVGNANMKLLACEDRVRCT